MDETESKRNKLPSPQGQAAATFNGPLQSISQQSTESRPSMNMPGWEYEYNTPHPAPAWEKKCHM